MIRKPASGRWLWSGYLAGGLLTMAAYYVTVAAGAPAAVRVGLYCAVSISAAVAVLYGCLRNRPAAPLPWILLGASQLIYSTADTGFYVSHFVLGDTSFPAPADVLYLSHYPLVVAGLVALIRLRSPGRDLPGLLDAALLAVVAGMLSWLYLIAPQAQADSPALVKIVSVGYPMMDLAMFAVALRLILGTGPRPVPFFLLSTNLLAFLAADSIYVFQQLNGTYGAGNFLDAIWLSGNLALGAAALHPAMGKIAEQAEEAAPAPGPGRIAGLCAAALIAPAVLLIQYANGSYPDIPVAACACAVLFVLTIARLAGLVSEQRRLAITDALTGLRTRRHFEHQLAVEVTRAHRAHGGLAVLIADVDRFKSVNDRYGHPAGDKVLTEIAERLKEATRDSDLLARYGGEEFAVLIRDIGRDEPALIAERLRRQVAERPIVVSGDTWLDVTISLGTASYPLHGSTPAELVTAADRALYAAKAHGRDQVVPAKGQHGELPEPSLDLVALADEVDSWVSGHEHSRAVGRWAGQVARSLGLDPTAARRAELAGRLHDVGKALIPAGVWTKPGALSEPEWELVRRHPGHGAALVGSVPGLGEVAEVVRQHHERFDGTGYPDGIAGTGIRIEARIVAVCDSWAAMLADRVYQPAMAEEDAARELRTGRGSRYDPDVVTAFLALHARGHLGPLPNLNVP
ncbi:diguanylate cyclase [Amycolatopsis nigrescens]|uniref:diguanylate cyclase n=1 Tax=Amycolatopsis nigrescens TaxID=381445 RepID=UPI000369D148|nr:diguanylate cyclase [Amycolatopsis nigrescens]